jgi:hypothetical protein
MLGWLREETVTRDGGALVETPEKELAESEKAEMSLAACGKTSSSSESIKSAEPPISSAKSVRGFG